MLGGRAARFVVLDEQIVDETCKNPPSAVIRGVHIANRDELRWIRRRADAAHARTRHAGNTEPIQNDVRR